MSENNPYQQYGYDHFPAAPENTPEPMAPSFTERVFGPSISAKLRNPLFATVSLLAVGAAFAAVIVFSYPSDERAEDVPTIKADTVAFKETPDEPGGMDVPYQDSAIFTAMRNEDVAGRQIENLLDPPEEAPVDRFAAFAQEAEEIMSDEADRAARAEPAAGEETSSTKNEATDASATEVKPVQEVQQIVQKIEKVTPRDEYAAAETSEPVKPRKLHAPGSSPETLAFVRSVLDKKDSKEASGEMEVAAATNAAPSEEIARSVNNIEPAAGAATGVGGYYVQLGSITDQARAEGEWGKLKKKYPTELEGTYHRVQRADLGERGIYYRIQAGPFTKEDASSKCAAIKAQKPGACLVVK